MTDAQEKRRLLSSSQVLETLSLLGLFAALLLFMKSVIEVYGIPYGIDFGEGYLANMSLEMVRGRNPYHALENPPWIVSSYPSLYPFLNGLIMAAVGRSLLPGRFIATASLIGVIVTTIILLRRLGVGPTIALLMAGMMLVFPWPVRWAQVVRVDTLGILFAILGLYFWVRSEGIRDASVSAVLFMAAAFTKHSLLAAPLACLVYAFISRDRRRIAFLLMLAILVGGGYGIANLVSGGGLFRHLFVYTANVFHVARLTAGLGEYLKGTWILQIAALSSLLMPGTLTGPHRLFGWYYLFAHLTLLAYGFTGSDTNYYIEPLLSTTILGALALNKLTIKSDIDTGVERTPFSKRAIALALILAVIVLARFVNTSDFKVHRMNPERLSKGLELLQLCASAPGDILSEDASFSFIGGKRVLFQPYIMTLLARTGKWDETPLIQAIEEQQYSMIVLRVDLNDPYNTEVLGGAWEMAGFDRWSERMEQAIMEHYTLYGAWDVGVGNLWYVYAPRFEMFQGAETFENSQPPEQK